MTSLTQTRLAVGDVDIPRIGLGTFRTSPDEARELVRAAIDVGYRHIDTARRYDNETGVGAGIRDSGLPREELFLTTKFAYSAAAPADAVASARSSLVDLGVDYVDLLLMHWPNVELVPEATFAALQPLVDEGVVRSLGISNAGPRLLRRVLDAVPLVNLQVEHHPYLPQDELLALVEEAGLTFTAYAPFAEGRVFNEPVIVAIGEKHGRTGGQVALRWLLDKPRTIVIPKTGRLDRLAQNIDGLDFVLDADDIAAIDALGGQQRRFFGDPPFPVDWS